VHTARIPKRKKSGSIERHAIPPQKPIAYMHNAIEGLSKHAHLSTQGILGNLAMSIFATFQ
jgi:hypothetical protein